MTGDRASAPPPDEVDFVSGRTRVYGIVGDPIEQVRSPEMITAEFVRRRIDALMIPVHVRPADFDACLAQLKRVQNLEIGRLLAHRYRLHGVDLRLGVGAAGFRTRPDGLTTVILSGGREVDCDIALVAIGCDPARELTPFEPEPPIYACGDVAGSGGHWTAAASEGIAVARKILGLEPLPEQPVTPDELVVEGRAGMEHQQRHKHKGA